jgi:plastocyanin
LVPSTWLQTIIKGDAVKHRTPTHKFVVRVYLLASIALICGLALPFRLMPVAHAAVYQVDRTDDVAGATACTTASNDCSLRGAITKANGSPGADSITLPAGEYILSIAGTGEDANATGDLDITDDLTINGAGHASTIINGGRKDRVLHIVADVTVTINGVTVYNGTAPDGADASDGTGGGGAHGGGIYNSGDLTLNASSVTENEAGAGGAGAGAPWLVGYSGGAGGHGGGICNAGNLSLNASTVRENAAGAGGTGAGWAIGGDGGSGGHGGGIYNASGEIALADTTVSANDAGTGGLGGRGGTTIGQGDAGSGGPGGHGGGVYSSGAAAQATVTHSTVSGNHAGRGGQGGMPSGGFASSGGNGGHGGGIYTTGDLTVNNSTVQDNSAGQGGNVGPGGQHSDGGSGGHGGGVYNSGSLTLHESTVRDNSAGNGRSASDGGARCPGSGGGVGGSGGHGGGIYSIGSTAVVSLTYSAIHENETGDGAAGGDGGAGTGDCSGGEGGLGGNGGGGGGVFNNGGSVQLTNSTVSSNATGDGGNGGTGGDADWEGNGGDGGDGGHGGGIHNAGGTVGLTNCTVSANSTGSRGAGGPHGSGDRGCCDGSNGSMGQGGGAYRGGSATINLKNTILAANSAAGSGPDCRGIVTSQNYNLLGNNSGCTFTPDAGDQVGTGTSPIDPRLGALTLNPPGKTQTHALLASSPAIDQIPDGSNGCGTTITDDQRGVVRPQVGGCDVGAFEDAEPGAIVVEKQTAPDGLSHTFDFTDDIEAPYSFGLSDDETKTFAAWPGTHTITETASTPDFDLTDITCSDANSYVDEAAGEAIVNLGSGETVTCTFSNRQRGTIVVEKQTEPHGAPGTFDFSADIGAPMTFSLSDGGLQTFTHVVSGTYTISETNPAPAFDLTDISCTDDNSGGDVATGVATVSLQPGETVTCTFSNRQRGTIVVEKQTDPQGAPGTFDFSADIGAPTTFSLSDGGLQTFTHVVSGTYTISETNPAPAFDLADIGCTDDNSGGDVAAGVATVSLQPGETVTCTFSNRQRGTIVIQKRTEPHGAPGTFDFADDIGAPTTFSLSDEGIETFTYVVSGTYTISETNPAPAFDLVDITCTDGNSSGDEATGVATVSLQPGETVTCTFSNRQRGTIVVEKQTEPHGAPGTFDFSADIGAPMTFSLSDDGLQTFTHVVSGTYTISETNPAPAFDLTDINCTDDNSGGGVAAGVATVSLQPGETVTCTFSNRQRGTIVVEKQTEPHGAPGTFDFSADIGAPMTFSLGDDGLRTFTHVVSGTYTISETNPAPAFDLADISCTDHNSSGDEATGVATVSLQPGETVTCTFSNRQRGTIVVEKQTEPHGAPGRFDFSADIGVPSTFSLADDGVRTFTHVVSGTYKFTETDPAPAFDLTDISCTDDNSGGDVAEGVATVSLQPGETVTCTFSNRQRGTIVVEKQTDPQGAPGTFDFSADIGAPTTFSLADGGVQTFTHVVLGTYTISETNPAPAFDLADISCTDDNSGGGVAERVATVSLQPGETVTCTFSNRQRGTIVVEKQTDPHGAPGTFDFADDIGAPLTFSLGDDGLQTFSHVVSGTYTISETNPAPAFDLTDVRCTDDNSGGDVATGVATVSLQPGETVTCTYGNRQRGTIVVEKQTDPGGLSHTFDFASNIGVAPTFSLTDDGTQRFPDVVPGTYAITETTPAPTFDLTDISCTDDNSRGDAAAGVATVNLEPGQTVTCTFSNRQRGTIVVEKQTDPQGAPGTFDFADDIGAPLTFSLSDDWIQTFSDVVSGTYAITETNPAPVFDLTDISCTDDKSGGDVATGVATVSLQPAETVTCTFSNRKRGGITVIKELSGSVLPHLAALVEDWEFGGDLGLFTIDGAGGEVYHPNLLPRQSYTISETQKFGFDVSVACDSSEYGVSSVTPHLDPGEEAVCIFTNTALDSDGDGIFDYIEGEQDRDGDGVANHLDYDPTGYIYELGSGRIISGGRISVDGPGRVTLHDDGSDGFYRFTTDGTPGTYAIRLTLPRYYMLSRSCLPERARLDPPTSPNPLVLGAGEVLSTGYLQSGLCTDNTYYFSFRLEDGDPFIINNNFPLDAAIGGVTQPVGRAALLKPWLALLAFPFLLLGTVAFCRKQGRSVCQLRHIDSQPDDEDEL